MELERLQNQIRYVNGMEDDALQGQRMKEEWDRYHRRVTEQQRTASRYAQPPSPQYSPTGYMAITPWSNPQPSYKVAAPAPPIFTGPAAPGFYKPYPTPPNSNSSNKSPQTARPGFTLYYPAQQPIPNQQLAVIPGPSSPVEEEPRYARPPARSSSRSSHRRSRSQGAGEYEDHRRSEGRRQRSDQRSNWSGSEEDMYVYHIYAVERLSVS